MFKIIILKINKIEKGHFLRFFNSNDVTIYIQKQQNLLDFCRQSAVYYVNRFCRQNGSRMGSQSIDIF